MLLWVMKLYIDFIALISSKLRMINALTSNSLVVRKCLNSHLFHCRSNVMQLHFNTWRNMLHNTSCNIFSLY